MNEPLKVECPCCGTTAESPGTCPGCGLGIPAGAVEHGYRAVRPFPGRVSPHSNQDGQTEEGAW